MDERLQIIKSIELLRKNSHNYKNKQVYSQKLHELYDKLSKTKIEQKEKYINHEKRRELIQNIKQQEKFNIFIFDVPDSEHVFGIKLLAEKYPIYNLILIEIGLDVDKNNFEIHLEPIYKNYDKKDVILEIAMLLKLFENCYGLYNKMIIFIIIYNILLENFSFIEENQEFKNTVKKKYPEFIKGSCANSTPRWFIFTSYHWW